SCTKNAVAPLGGVVALATYVPPPWSESVLLVQLMLGLMLRRKSRVVGFVACHCSTLVGAVVVCTTIEPSCWTLQENCGSGRLFTTASKNPTVLIPGSVLLRPWPVLGM